MYLRQMRSGNWQVVVEHRGIVRRSSAPTKSEAIQKGAQLLVEIGGNPTSLASMATVAVVLSEHRSRKETTWSAQYLADFDRLVDRLPGEFLDRPAVSIHPVDIDALYRRLRTEGLSEHRIQRLHGFLSGAFRRAARLGWIRSSPCVDMNPPIPAAPDITVPTSEQLAALIRCAPEGLPRTFVRVAAITGARRGELVGMQWADFDARSHEVVIRRAITRDRTGRATVGPGKSGRRGHRVLALDPVTCHLLVDHHADQKRRAAAHRLPSPVWIFSADAGATPWHPDIGTDVFDAARSAAKVAGVRLHDLRHHVATSMLEDGETPMDVANQLGDRVETVLRTYAHYLPGRGRDATLRRAAALG